MRYVIWKNLTDMIMRYDNYNSTDQDFASMFTFTSVLNISRGYFECSTGGKTSIHLALRPWAEHDPVLPESRRPRASDTPCFATCWQNNAHPLGGRRSPASLFVTLVRTIANKAGLLMDDGPLISCHLILYIISFHIMSMSMPIPYRNDNDSGIITAHRIKSLIFNYYQSYIILHLHPTTGKELDHKKCTMHSEHVWAREAGLDFDAGGIRCHPKNDAYIIKNDIRSTILQDS